MAIERAAGAVALGKAEAVRIIKPSTTVGSPPTDSKSMLERLAQPENTLLLSAASSWEIAIKYALGKLKLPEKPSKYVRKRLQSSGTTELPVHHAHALAVADLPHYHRDPFDRLLIAQAQLDDLLLVADDKVFSKYDVNVISPRSRV